MNFEITIKNLLNKFKNEDVRYALIGGFALGARGVTRTTVDIDFLVHFDDVTKIDKIMNDLDYECRYKSENVTQYFSLLKVFGSVDFLHAFREISVGMLERAEEISIFKDTITVKVVNVEDLIGLKIQAVANDESRKTADIADIESLLAQHSKLIDWALVEKYFSIFEFHDLFSKLKERYMHAQ